MATPHTADTDEDPGGEGIAGDFAVLARALQAQDTVQHTLEVMCKLAVHVIGGTQHAGITVLRNGRFETPAASDAVPPVVDRIQYETGQGPCVDAIRTRETLELDDLSTDGRWPAFTARMVAETAVRSMLSYRLFVQAHTLGALNLYSDEPHAFAHVDRALGTTFAAHAAVAMRAATDHAQVINLRSALDSNRRIGVAMGIIMCRHALTEDQSFDGLRQVSQYTNRKLRDVADDVILTGDLDLPAPRNEPAQYDPHPPTPGPRGPHTVTTRHASATSTTPG